MSLGVCFHSLRVAVILVRRTVSAHGGGSMSDDSGGHAGCVEPKFVARQRMEIGNTSRGQLISATGECNRNWRIVV